MLCRAVADRDSQQRCRPQALAGNNQRGAGVWCRWDQPFACPLSHPPTPLCVESWLQPGVKIVSASYGGPSDAASGASYISMLRQKGILFVAAAGVSMPGQC